MRTSRLRPAFTLVEMLVVISIIGILAALVAAGIFQVIESQRASNTETTIRTVNKILQAHMKAVVEKANKEAVPQKILMMAGGDQRRARVIWKKLRIKQEFPMTFAEAIEPHKDYGGNLVDIMPPSKYYLDSTDLPSLYAKTFAPPLPLPATINNPAQPFVESSTCLLLALKQSRGGSPGLSPDELGTAAIDVNGDGIKEIVDGWGNPMAFFRFPTGDPTIASVADELDNSNPATPGSTATNFRDPLDPEGLLLNKGWLLIPDGKGKIVLTPGAVNFERLCHRISKLDSTTGNAQPWPRYNFPVLASSGRNGALSDFKWGLNASVFQATGAVFNPDLTPVPALTPPPPTPLQRLPIPPDGDDNIYSFRLRGD